MPEDPLPTQTFRDLRKRRGGPSVAIILALVILAMVALVGFGVLGILILKHRGPDGDAGASLPPPAPTNEVAAVSTNAAPPAPPPKPPVDPVVLAKRREAAEASLAKQLKLQRALVDIEAQVWGGPAYSNAVEAVTRADAAFQDEDFPAAQAAYDEAHAHLLEVEADKPRAFQSYMAKGKAALGAGRGREAEDAFTVATRIRPDDADAAKGLKRARTIEQVIAKLARGEEHEQAGRLPFAQAEFAEIAQIDPDFEPGRTALARVQESIVERKFQSAMSEGLAAYERKDFQRAKGIVVAARAMRPDSPQIGEALKLIEEGIKREKLDALERQGAAALEAEDYETALALYNQALVVEPNVSFARAGADRAAQAIGLLQQLNRFLDQPDKLANPTGLENATQVAAEAAAFENPRSGLAAKIAALDELVTRARTPATVLIKSDGKTSVDVYRVGRFGRIRSKELQLRPGTYTAVGARAGYRDARVVFTVKFGEAPAPVEVVCTEKVP